MTAKTPTSRSKARNLRAATVLPPTTLNAAEAAALAQIQAATGENKAAIVRRLIISESNQLPTLQTAS